MKSSISKLKPLEGVKLRLPNGDPAIDILTHRSITVETQESNNRVRLIINFDKPFIERKN